MIELIGNWNGEFTVENVPATIYSVWKSYFMRKMFLNYIEEGAARSLYSNYMFEDFYVRLLTALLKDPKHDKYNRVICNMGADKQPKGSHPTYCIHNLA